MISPRIESPVFLVGAERSGSTMLRLMLQGHGCIAFAPEFDFVVDRVSDDASAALPGPEEFHEYLRANRIFLLQRLTIDCHLRYAEQVQSFLTQIRDRKPGCAKVVGATVHHGFDRLLRLWPDARFLHLIRDPRDVARSVISERWAGNVWTAVDVWIEAEKRWDAVLKAMPPDRWIEVKYENLLSEPERQLTEVCRFLKIPYDPRMLSYPEVSTYKAPNPKHAFQWKTKLNDREVQLIEAKVGPLLSLRGYEPSGLSLVTVGPRERKVLLIQDHWYRTRHRLKFFGVRLFLADYLVRRCGPRWLQNRVRDRIHAVINSRLK